MEESSSGEFEVWELENSQGTLEAFKKWGAHVFRGTLINESWQLFKLKRGTLPNNLR